MIGEKDALAISLKDSRAQLESVRSQLTAEQKQVQASQKELAEARAAHTKLETAKADAIAAREKEAAGRAAADTEVQTLRAQLETARKDGKRAATEASAAVEQKCKAEVALNAANSQAQAAEAKLTAVTTLFKTSAARVQALEREQEQHAAAMRDLEARLHATPGLEAESYGPSQGPNILDGLLGAFDALSGATTIVDVLATLGEQLAAEFPRVALFRVKGNRLEGTHQIGFDLTNDIGKVIIPLAMDSVLTRAVTSGHTERLSGNAIDTSGLPFGGSPTFALAMPIVVDAESIAIVYADDFAEPRQESRNDDDVNAKFAEALRQHTVALLMRLTTELKAMAELRAYAGSLLTEIEQMYQSDVSRRESRERSFRGVFTPISTMRGASTATAPSSNLQAPPRFSTRRSPRWPRRIATAPSGATSPSSPTGRPSRDHAPRKRLSRRAAFTVARHIPAEDQQSALGAGCPCRRSRPTPRQRKGHVDAARGGARLALASPGGDHDELTPVHLVHTGVAFPENGNVVSHSSSPVFLSNAWNFRSKFVAPMKTRPPAVTTGPP